MSHLARGGQGRELGVDDGVDCGRVVVTRQRCEELLFPFVKPRCPTQGRAAERRVGLGREGRRAVAPSSDGTGTARRRNGGGGGRGTRLGVRRPGGRARGGGGGHAGVYGVHEHGLAVLVAVALLLMREKEEGVGECVIVVVVVSHTRDCSRIQRWICTVDVG